MTFSLPRLRRSIALAIACAAVAGCATLPEAPPRTTTSARADTRDTALGRLAAASLDGAGPGESGFRLLPTGDFALDARLALARRAERSLDVQYYQLQRDSVGLAFLRALGDAAARGVRVRLLVRSELVLAGGVRALVDQGAPVQPAAGTRRLARRPLRHVAARVSLTFAPAEVFADTPAKVDLHGQNENLATVARSTLEAINATEREVMIASPYFIPGPLGMAMMEKARAQGMRIVVITNALGATDEPLVHWRYARYRRDLLRLGVEIYELSPNLARNSGRFGDFGRSFGRLHAKVAVIDRRTLFVGSLNLDQRSAWSNTESGLLIDSPALAQDILDLVANDPLESVYKLRLAADGATIEWVATRSDGSEHPVSDEPDSSWWLSLKMFLVGPFTSEDLL